MKTPSVYCVLSLNQLEAMITQARQQMAISRDQGLRPADSVGDQACAIFYGDRHEDRTAGMDQISFTMLRDSASSEPVLLFSAASHVPSLPIPARVSL